MINNDWFTVTWDEIKTDAEDLLDTASLGGRDTLTYDAVPKMYKVRLYNRDSVDITANIPQSFSIQLSSSWDDPYSKSMLDDENGGLVNNKGAPGLAGNVNPTAVKELGGLEWQSGAHLDFSIPFAFYANKSTKLEVIQPMLRMLKLVAPSVDGSKLIKPDFRKDPLTLEIGNFLRLSPVIVDSVGEEINSMFDKDGAPIAVVITVSIKSLYTMTTDALDKMFLLK